MPLLAVKSTPPPLSLTPFLKTATLSGVYYPGGLKTKVFKDIIEDKPEYIIEEAVKGMLPKNKLGKQMFKKLKVYKGENHPHESQEPQIWEPKL